MSTQTEILGYDIDGKALRAGSHVALVGPMIKDKWQGRIRTVAGPLDQRRWAQAVALTGVTEYWLALETNHAVPADQVRLVARIDDANEVTSWDEIQKDLGWNPTKDTVTK